MLNQSNVLKLALFATGLSGIVAEYILSTLATYFLGNSTLQWTMILSSMLFTMGLGSRISKFIDSNILEKFILIEFLLSVLVSFCALFTYGIAAYTSFEYNVFTHNINHTGVLVYFLSLFIGLLIGMEIPLVIRLNDEYESLRVNISSAMEKDYYGSLVGGAFFAFIGLPFLGLTYTPFILGSINFAVAILLYFRLNKLVAQEYKKIIIPALAFVFTFISAGAFFAKDIVNYGEQKLYRDKVVFQTQSKYQKIVVTQWKNDYWLYLNGNQQLSTFDEWMYHEPMVHPVMGLSQNPSEVLILGGGDGCAAREVLKYENVDRIKLVDLDPKVTELGQTHPIFTKLNGNSLNHPKLSVLNADGYTYLANTDEYFDIIIIDFPDPKTIELGRLYTLEFYKMCYNHLRPNGVLVVQSGSPYYATKAYRCIEKTVASAGFNTIPIHNQVLTLGQWGWIIGARSIPKEELKPRLQNLNFEGIETKWLTEESMNLITSFGKDLIKIDSTEVEVNTIQNPVLYRYYDKGNWDLF